MRWFGNSRVGLFEPCALSLKCRLEWLLGRYRPAAKGRKPPLSGPFTPRIGIVAKRVYAPYAGRQPVWVKIKNRDYSRRAAVEWQGG